MPDQPKQVAPVKDEMQGFSSWEATDISIRLGERRQVTGIALNVGNLSETVSVTSRPEIAPMDSGDVRLTRVTHNARTSGEGWALKDAEAASSSAARATT